MKRSIVLFELILSIVIISIVGVYSIIFLKDIEVKNRENLKQNIVKTELFTAYNIVQNRKQNSLNSILVLNDKKLYLDGVILLDDVVKFNSSGSKIDICIKKDILICQTWEDYE